MTTPSRDDIIRMARESGGIVEVGMAPVFYTHDELIRFATLVAAAEREACAKVCDDKYRVLEARRAAADCESLFGANHAYFVPVMSRVAECAAVIRERGLTPASTSPHTPEASPGVPP